MSAANFLSGTTSEERSTLLPHTVRSTKRWCMSTDDRHDRTMPTKILLRPYRHLQLADRQMVHSWIQSGRVRYVMKRRQTAKRYEITHLFSATIHRRISRSPYNRPKTLTVVFVQSRVPEAREPELLWVGHVLPYSITFQVLPEKVARSPPPRHCPHRDGTAPLDTTLAPMDRLLCCGRSSDRAADQDVELLVSSPRLCTSMSSLPMRKSSE